MIMIAAFGLLLVSNVFTMGCNKSMASFTHTTDTTATIITPPPPPVIDSQHYKTYLALGDSYTIGQSVDSSSRYPAQTAAWLAANGIRLNPIQYIATTGWTTTDLQNAINYTNPKGPFDVVSLLIGVNDQYRGYDTGGYSIRFYQLLQQSIQLAGGKPAHVFVLSIPDYSVTPFANGSNRAEISMQIDWFNAINKRITLQNNCNYLYITDSTREAATDSSLLAPDGLHPSGKEYKIWSLLLGALMKTVL